VIVRTANPAGKIPATMKAIRVHQFGEPDVLKFEETADPKPAAGQVLVRIKAVGVNPVETYVRAGRYGPKEFPYTPGNDGAGIIEAVGTGVKQWKPGDRVYVAGSISGTYAQLALCDAKKVHRLPENASFEEGASLGVPAATAWRGLFQRGGAQRGETMLIHGASGGVGTMAVQLARDAGLTLIATAGSDKGRELVRKLGAQHVLDHHSPDYLKEVMSITQGKGVNLILEMLANVNLGKDLTVLAKFGRVVVIGSRGKVEIDPRDTMGRDADIRGMTINNLNDQDYEAIHTGIVAAVEKGRLKPIIETTLPLAEAARAHQLVMEGDSHGKIILIP
jgi:NADPH2:quinone reductase